MTGTGVGTLELRRHSEVLVVRALQAAIEDGDSYLLVDVVGTGGGYSTFKSLRSLPFRMLFNALEFLIDSPRLRGVAVRELGHTFVQSLRTSASGRITRTLMYEAEGLHEINQLC
ncbi:hypothetical protein BDR05DRAFT_992168 [Suillus weaverae]|nr:hypothetical protein BDR05DRAFT_992168 [Suillus weaverae]